MTSGHGRTGLWTFVVRKRFLTRHGTDLYVNFSNRPSFTKVRHPNRTCFRVSDYVTLKLPLFVGLVPLNLHPILGHPYLTVEITTD